MTEDPIFNAFLQTQLQQGLALARASGVLRLSPLPNDPPFRYVAHFDGCQGLVKDTSGEVVEFDQFVVGIWFPTDYLRAVDVGQILTYLGPHPSPFHPNLRPPFLCAHIQPGTSLVDILYAVYEIWTWNLFSTADGGLNRAAAQWSRRQDPKRFPIDRRPLKRARAVNH